MMVEYGANHMAGREREGGGPPPFNWDPLTLLRDLERALGSIHIGEAPRPMSRMPMMDLRDEGERYVIEAELPGMAKEDVEIEIEDSVLILRAGRETSNEYSRERFLRRERDRSYFHRRLSLPDDVDLDSVTARLNNGVLTLTLPKREGGEGRRRVDID